MRKNIFLKSMLRQPMRTGLLVLLIALASFAFFLRTVEFVAVRAEIRALEGNFRTIGTVQADDYWADASAVADILENSSFVRYVDRMLGIEGILLNMHSPDLGGRPIEEPTRLTDAIFAAVVVDMDIQSFIRGGESHYFAWTTLYIYEVFAGFPAHVVQGQIISLGLDANAADNLGWTDAIGGTFLFRTNFAVQFGYFGVMLVPRVGRDSPGIWLTPLDGDGLWTLPFYRLQEVGYDFSQVPEIAHLAEHIRFLNHHQRGIYLQPTRDMSAMPVMQPEARIRLGWPRASDVADLFRLHPNGRGITYEDYLNANPVAVVSNMFAHLNQVSVGDILEISIPLNQRVERLMPAYRDFLIRSTPVDYHYHVIELEIVGTYFDFARIRTTGTFCSSFVYFPASLMPEGIILSPPAYGELPGWYEYGHLPSIWLGFELYSAREEQYFMEAYADIIEGLGFGLMIFEVRAQAFWATIDPMLLIITFNAAVFWVVLALVLALVVFLFLQQRRKDMAVQRALGFSVKRLLWRFWVCTLWFGVPAVLTGGALGWILALTITDYTLSPLADIIPGFVPAVSPSYGWFVGMTAIVIGLLVVFVGAGVGYMAKYPVLEQLQGVKAKRNKATNEPTRSVKTAEGNEYANTRLQLGGNFKVGDFIPVAAPMQRFASGTRFILRHISRSPAKSVLGIFVALFFVLVLGWLSESIVRTGDSIDRLYESTIVHGEIRQANPFDLSPGRYLGDVIWRHTVENVAETGFIENIYVEAGHFRSFVIPPGPDGTGPENWYEIIGYDRDVSIFNNLDALDFMFAFNDMDIFMAENYIEGVGGVAINYAPGFGSSDFVRRPGEPVPLIISEVIAERRGVGLGDEVLIGFTRYVPTTWNYVPAVVIGIHNDAITRAAAQGAMLLHTDAIAELMDGMTLFTTFRFTVNPDYNRDILYVHDYINSIITGRTAGVGRLLFTFWDQLLHTLVGVANQTLLLLELVYPVALTASAAIAGGLSMLLILQTAKTAAILHVLGTTKKKTVVILLMDQVLVCLAGMLPALVVLAIIGVTFSSMFLLSLGIYFTAIVIGAFIGAVLVVKRPALGMLQVRE
ncbi:MAG: ABC transporter permease [Defluviitaleaceae bacterium]|nr:ABC transporter permease [Defluviitaleaceae bacterium]